MMIEKVSNGQSVRDAKNSIEREFRFEKKENISPKALLSAPDLDNLAPEVDKEIQTVESFVGLPNDNYETMDFNLFDEQNSIIGSQYEETIFPEKTFNEIQTTSAYEQAWGRNEPEWYNEKKPVNRLDSALEDVTETMESDIFGFGAGGLFDAEPAKSSFTEPVNYSPPSTSAGPGHYITNQNNETENTNSIFGSEYNNQEITTRRSMSSAEMIRAANGLTRSPINDYSETRALPEPTDEAVRTECRPGLVKRAKAQQSLYRKAEAIASLPAPADLGDYPGLSKIANSYENGRLSLRKQPNKKKKVGLIEKLLVPRHRNYERKYLDYSSEYGDPDGIQASETSRFQSKQHLRIRSDQEHQADISNRISRMNNTEPSSAKDALNKVVNRVSRGEEHSPTELNSGQPLLRFNQMRRTSNNSDEGHLRGIKRLN